MKVEINQIEKVYNVVVNHTLRRITTNITLKPKETTVDISQLGKRGFHGKFPIISQLPELP